ncbi:MAG: response regulator [Bacteriovoracia bacterium]
MSDFNQKILIVDDELAILQLLEQLLSAFPVITAGSGKEAIQLLEEQEVCIIISDFKMPEMNGVELLENSKAINPQLSFYMLTAYGDKDLVVTALDIGLDGYFDKPVDSKKLIEKIENDYASRKEIFYDEQQLLESYFEDSFHTLEEIEYKLLVVKESADNLQDLKRLLHTLKGTSSFFSQMQPIEDLCHKMEDLIKAFDKEEVILSDKAIAVLLRSADELKTMLEQLQSNLNSRFDVTSLIEQLQKIEIKADIIIEETPKPQGKQEVQKKKSEGIFVQSERLDNLMELGGELIILRNFLSDLAISGLERKNSTFSATEKIKDIYHQLDGISELIQSNIMAIRKVPIAQVFQTYHRVVYDMGKQTNKRVSLKVNDNDIQVDKDVARYLGDAMVHLIRNSIDHGLETPEERQKQGKIEEGHVILEACETAGSTLITIADNGKGLNYNAILEKAVNKKIISPEEANNMAKDDIANLIFSPGFSTAQQVTKISGRGEGMDIVKDAINKLNGKINVKSVEGDGSTFTIDIPHIKSINILKALVVNIMEHKFFIPINQIDKIITIHEDELHNYNESDQFIKYNDSIINVIHLKKVIDFNNFPVTNYQKEKSTNSKITLVILTFKHKKVALIVDEVEQQMQIVSRNFDEILEDLEGFKGTTVLQSGAPALILDTETIIKKVSSSVVVDSNVS